MTPAYRVLADDNDITTAIRHRLLSLRVTDEAGYQSDAVEIQLDDRAATRSRCSARESSSTLPSATKKSAWPRWDSLPSTRSS